MTLQKQIKKIIPLKWVRHWTNNEKKKKHSKKNCWSKPFSRTQEGPIVRECSRKQRLRTCAQNCPPDRGLISSVVCMSFCWVAWLNRGGGTDTCGAVSSPVSCLRVKNNTNRPDRRVRSESTRGYICSDDIADIPQSPASETSWTPGDDPNWSEAQWSSAHRFRPAHRVVRWNQSSYKKTWSFSFLHVSAWVLQVKVGGATCLHCLLSKLLQLSS